MKIKLNILGVQEEITKWMICIPTTCDWNKFILINTQDQSLTEITLLKKK
jgi:hypothetical protein